MLWWALCDSRYFLFLFFFCVCVVTDTLTTKWNISFTSILKVPVIMSFLLVKCFDICVGWWINELFFLCSTWESNLWLKTYLSLLFLVIIPGERYMFPYVISWLSERNWIVNFPPIRRCLFFFFFYTRKSREIRVFFLFCYFFLVIVGSLENK